MDDIRVTEVGDMALLQSGGPLMSVVAIQKDMATCRWLNRNDDPATAEFPVSVLVLVRPTPKVPVPQTTP